MAKTGWQLVAMTAAFSFVWGGLIAAKIVGRDWTVTAFLVVAVGAVGLTAWWLLSPRYAIVGTDGVNVTGWQWNSTHNMIEIRLTTGRSVALYPTSDSEQYAGTFVETVLDNLHEPLVGSQPDSENPPAFSGSPKELSRMLASGDGDYRTAPVSRAHAWSIATNPAAEPQARANALTALAPHLSSDQRQNLTAMAWATAHPQVTDIIAAVVQGKPHRVLEALSQGMRRRPIRIL